MLAVQTWPIYCWRLVSMPSNRQCWWTSNLNQESETHVRCLVSIWRPHDVVGPPDVVVQVVRDSLGHVWLGSDLLEWQSVAWRHQRGIQGSAAIHITLDPWILVMLDPAAENCLCNLCNADENAASHRDASQSDELASEACSSNYERK